MQKVIAEKCPSCETEWKIVLRCKECLNYCCSECSVDNKCLECYVEQHVKEELKIYMHDKERMIT